MPQADTNPAASPGDEAKPLKKGYVRVRTTMRPWEDLDVPAREARTLKRHGLLVDEGKGDEAAASPAAAAAAPAASAAPAA